MEPFSIACTTCQARLRVRDKSVIGQILTCPKCGSMVLVEPVAASVDSSQNAELPAPQDAAPVSEPDPSARISATHANFEDAASLFDEPDKPSPPDSPDLTDTVEDLAVQSKSRRRSAEEINLDSEVTSGWKSEPVAADEPDDESSTGLSPPPLPESREALLPNADWTSASTVQWRNRILTGIAAVVGVGLAVMLLVVFSGGGDSPTIASVPATPEAPSIGGVAPGDAAALPLDDRVENATTPPDPSSLPEDPASNAGVDTAAESSEPPLVSPAEPAADASIADPVASEVEAVANDPPTDEPPGLTPKETTTAPATADGEPSPLAETMREFGELLEKTETLANPLPEVAEEMPEAGEPEGKPVVRRTGHRVVQLDERLRDSVAQIQFDGVPLVKFLQFVSDYSTIPITLDADILRWTRVSPVTAVNLTAAETTVAEILKQGLAPLGLEYRIEADQLFVTRRPKNESGVLEVTFKVEDLVGDDAAQLQQLGAQIMDFASPDSWSSRGGIGTITFQGSAMIIEQHEPVQFEILEYCEKLRVARGLEKRGRYDASMFRLETRGERARAKLAKSITLTYIRPAALQRIVDRIAEASQLHILIDWRALAEAGWSPDAEVPFSVADQPVTKALATLLGPMDLAYRVVDESTLQITTPTELDSRLEFEFYRVPKLDVDGAEFLQAARDALGPANFRDAGGSGQLVFDKPSMCLLACLSQTRQIELQAWLATPPDATTDSASLEKTTPTATVESNIGPASGQASND